MSEAPHATRFTPPRARTLLAATLGALVAAAILLVVAVLPAEYDIDPTGAGEALGLTGLSAAAPEEAPPETAAAPAPAPAPAETGAPPAIRQFAHIHDGDAPRDTVRISLEEGEEVEYKATLAKGEVMLFSWSVPEGDVYFDFHGEPTQGDFEDGYFLSYGEGESDGRKGSFVAPFTGHHGWYWLNYSAETVTIELTLQGYYSSHAELYRGRNF